MVVTPERMVIDEARRAHTDLSLFEISCDAVVMNRLLPEQATAESYFKQWGEVQNKYLQEVKNLFQPLTILQAPLQKDEVIGLKKLTEHGENLFAHCEPDATISHFEGPRYSRSGDDYLLEFPLPHVSKNTLDISKVDDELFINTGTRRRIFVLPRRMVALSLSRAELNDDLLSVHFSKEPVPLEVS